ncbi:bifunctional UDP-N-acetylglucosamine diphosphorylase/glucosamine-1-phosphate N-acetyltransferase GlmU [Holdemanella biformis]
MRNAIVLAAGKGTRMKSDRSKVMHTIIDRSMLAYIIDALRAVSVQRIVLIVGYQAESIKEAFPDVEFALQQPQLGTGHAVMQATQLKDEDGDTLIINGDGPCIQPETLEKLFQTNQDASLTLLTSVLDDGAHYGRIVRDENGHVQAIVEAKDCTEEQKKICEINAGMYCFKNRDLFDNLDKLTTNNAQNEYYLTDLVKILANQGKVVKGLVVENRDEVMGINDCVELNKAYEWMRNRINNNWMKEGVQIVDPKRTVIGKDVKIGHDVIIHPNVEILGKTEIGNFVEILPGSYLNNSKIEDRAVVDSSKIVDSCIDEGTVVGPMSYVSNNKIIK